MLMESRLLVIKNKASLTHHFADNLEIFRLQAQPFLFHDNLYRLIEKLNLIRWSQLTIFKICCFDLDTPRKIKSLYTCLPAAPLLFP